MTRGAQQPRPRLRLHRARPRFGGHREPRAQLHEPRPPRRARHREHPERVPAARRGARRVHGRRRDGGSRVLARERSRPVRAGRRLRRRYRGCDGRGADSPPRRRHRSGSRHAVLADAGDAGAAGPGRRRLQRHRVGPPPEPRARPRGGLPRPAHPVAGSGARIAGDEGVWPLHRRGLHLRRPHAAGGQRVRARCERAPAGPRYRLARRPGSPSVALGDAHLARPREERRPRRRACLHRRRRRDGAHGRSARPAGAARRRRVGDGLAEPLPQLPRHPRRPRSPARSHERGATVGLPAVDVRTRGARWRERHPHAGHERRTHELWRDAARRSGHRVPARSVRERRGHGRALPRADAQHLRGAEAASRGLARDPRHRRGGAVRAGLQAARDDRRRGRERGAQRVPAAPGTCETGLRGLRGRGGRRRRAGRRGHRCQGGLRPPPHRAQGGGHHARRADGHHPSGHPHLRRARGGGGGLRRRVPKQRRRHRRLLRARVGPHQACVPRTRAALRAGGLLRRGARGAEPR